MTRLEAINEAWFRWNIDRMGKPLGTHQDAFIAGYLAVRPVELEGVESGEAFIGSLDYQTNGQCIIEAERWKAAIIRATERSLLERIKINHDTCRAGGVARCCGDSVGYIYAKVDTLFGAEEDRAVLTFGRARVYGGGIRP